MSLSIAERKEIVQGAHKQLSRQQYALLLDIRCAKRNGITADALRSLDSKLKVLDESLAELDAELAALEAEDGSADS